VSDKTFFVEIVRANVDGYTNRVQNEEAGAAKFVDNAIREFDGNLVNLATFEALGPGRVPPLPTFVKLGQMPAGKTAEWTGVLLLGGSNTAVQMFRDEEGS
jgi:hypothetical protein